MSKVVWLSIAEAHTHTGIPKTTLKRWCRREKGALKHRVTMKGRKSRIEIKQSDLDSYERPQMGGAR
jgi:hypothetical protein